MYQYSVSIIIPNYNNQHSLKLMLQALKKIQYSYELLEIIIIDDCSTDLSQKILKNFNAPNHFFIFFNKNNKGRSFTRNIGIQKAKNEIVIFLDGDLIPDSNFVLEHVKYHQDKNVSIVKGYVKSAILDKIQYYYYQSGLSGPYNFSDFDILPPQYIVTNNLSIKRQFVVLFNEDLIGYGGEDTILAYELDEKLPKSFIYGKKAIALDPSNYSLKDVLGKYEEFGNYNLHILQKNYPQIFNHIMNSRMVNSFFQIILSNFIFIYIMKILYHISTFKISSYILKILIYSYIIRGYRKGI